MSSIFTKLLESAADDIAAYRGLKNRTDSLYSSSKLYAKLKSNETFTRSIDIGTDIIDITITFLRFHRYFSFSFSFRNFKISYQHCSDEFTTPEEAIDTIYYFLVDKIMCSPRSNDGRTNFKNFYMASLAEAIEFIDGAVEFYSKLLRDDVLDNFYSIVKDSLRDAFKPAVDAKSYRAASINRDKRVDQLKTKAEKSLKREKSKIKAGDEANIAIGKSQKKVKILSVDAKSKTAKVETMRGTTMTFDLKKLSKIMPEIEL